MYRQVKEKPDKMLILIHRRCENYECPNGANNKSPKYSELQRNMMHALVKVCTDMTAFILKANRPKEVFEKITRKK